MIACSYVLNKDNDTWLCDSLLFYHDYLIVNVAEKRTTSKRNLNNIVNGCND